MHYCDVIMGVVAAQITSLTFVYWTAHSGADQRKHQSSASLAFVRGIHLWPVNSPHNWLVTRKMFPFDGVIMVNSFRPVDIHATLDRAIIHQGDTECGNCSYRTQCLPGDYWSQEWPVTWQPLMVSLMHVGTDGWITSVAARYDSHVTSL